MADGERTRRKTDFQSLIGQRFERLVVTGLARKYGTTVLACVCDCGTNVTATQQQLFNGRAKSCGCFKRDRAKTINFRHGMSQTRTHRIWWGMIRRCTEPSFANWSDYGGRGIRVCERWLTFENFLADMGECQPGMTIERKDTNAGYDPGNCVWATPIEQARNKRNSRRYEYRGKLRSMAEIAELSGVHYGTLRSRLRNYGWDLERAISQPVQVRSTT